MAASDDQKGAGAPEALAGGVFASGITALEKVRQRLGGGGSPPPPPSPPSDGDEEEDGMLRMSFMEHLEELRSRIFKALTGVAAMFLLSLTFSGPLWSFICKPAIQALKTLGYEETLVMIEPM